MVVTNVGPVILIDVISAIKKNKFSQQNIVQKVIHLLISLKQISKLNQFLVMFARKNAVKWVHLLEFFFLTKKLLFIYL